MGSSPVAPALFSRPRCSPRHSSGCSAVGSAFGSGPKGRRFKPAQPDKATPCLVKNYWGRKSLELFRPGYCDLLCHQIDSALRGRSMRHWKPFLVIPRTVAHARQRKTPASSTASRAYGKRIGRGYVEACRGYLNHHVMHCLGHLRISDLSSTPILPSPLPIRRLGARP